MSGSSETRVIWYIDEDKRQLRTYKSRFEKALPKDTSIDVVGIRALPHMEDYLELLKDPRTGCIIIDQRLKETGEVDHTGIELATFLRSIKPKLPIYILTNFAYEHDEYAEGEWTVEDIISKTDLGDQEKLIVIVARMLRRMSVYDEILGDREKRFRYLLQKSLNEQLDDYEQLELEELKFFRFSSLHASEMPYIRELKDTLGELKEITSKIPKSNGEKGE